MEKALIAHGLVPPHCRLLDIVFEVNAAPKLRYEVFLDDDDLRKFADAFADALNDESGK
jgi:hypothetical protein